MSYWSEMVDPAQRADMLQRMLTIILRQYARDAGQDAVGRVAEAFTRNGFFTDEEAARVFLNGLDK